MRNERNCSFDHETEISTKHINEINCVSFRGKFGQECQLFVTK